MKKAFVYSSIIAILVLYACNAQKSVDPGGSNTLPIGVERSPDTTKTDIAGKADTAKHLPDTLLKNEP